MESVTILLEVDFMFDCRGYQTVFTNMPISVICKKFYHNICREIYKLLSQDILCWTQFDFYVNTFFLKGQYKNYY